MKLHILKTEKLSFFSSGQSELSTRNGLVRDKVFYFGMENSKISLFFINDKYRGFKFKNNIRNNDM